MSRYTLLLLMVLVLFAAGCSKGEPGRTSAPAAKNAANSAEGTAIELEPSPEGFPLGLAVSEGFALHLFDTPGANQGFKTFPPESGAKRHYDEFTLAGKVHLVITEESAPPRMYFDENRNGDLTDDRPPSEGEAPELVPNHYSILVLYEDEKVVAPYRLWLFGSNMGGVRFYPKCHWHGTLTVKGTPYRIVAFDGNADGDYSNDPVVIDVNGNDKADDDEQLTPGRGITIDGQQVTLVSVSRSGLTVRFKM
ncbi:MAG TPA: hypothetical protein VFY07_00715 [Geomobilimonas sp.]|nr:hypothetical protein [Geomobilimonas sp.]